MGILKDIQNIGDSERSTDNLERRALKAGEEMGELAEAVLSLTSASKGKNKRYMDMVEEACDVTIMGLDIALTKPPHMDGLSDLMWRAIVKKIIGLKLEKWRKQLTGKATLIHPGEIDFEEGELDKYLDSPEEEFIEDPETGLIAKRSTVEKVQKSSE